MLVSWWSNAFGLVSTLRHDVFSSRIETHLRKAVETGPQAVLRVPRAQRKLPDMPQALLEHIAGQIFDRRAHRGFQLRIQALVG